MGGDQMNSGMRCTALVLATLLVGFTACSDKQTTDNDDLVAIDDLLVRNNEITGWTYSGTGWVANNISELTTHIDGLAEIYERHGFVEAAHQSYQGTIDDATRTLRLTVYNQGTQSNANDTFEDPDTGFSGATTWNDGPGEAAHYVRFGGLSQALAFYQGSYFVQLDMSYDTEESLNVLKAFALNVSGKID
jgi:hypothetical protein